MKKSIPSWQIAGFVFTSALGTFLHFLFDLTGGSAVAALISTVNESIWEHMKLIFYPMVLFGAVQYRAFGKDMKGFWCVKLKGILLALMLIPTIYYLYTGALGVSADWFNITIFFLAAAAAYRYETKLFEENRPCIAQWLSLALTCFIGLLFTVFTFGTPHIPLFQDPITGTYGFQG